MASSNLQIDNGVLKDDLNCVKCKSILKDACLVPCGCRLCRVCINDLMASGVPFCPGPSEECGKSFLSQFVTDYKANRNISKLPIKCSNNGCVHVCPLANMEEHLRVCPRKSVECPFCEFGCTHDKMAAVDMSDHLQRESLSHIGILIGMINNINNEREGSKRDIEMTKKTNESIIQENEVLKDAYICFKKKIDVLENTVESNKREIDMLKKADEYTKTEMEMMKKTNESNKIEIQLLKGKYESTIRRIDIVQIAAQSDEEEIGAQKKANQLYKAEVEVLKEKDERNMREIEVPKTAYIWNKKKIDMLKKKKEKKRREIEILERADKSNKKETELVKETVDSMLQEVDMLKEKDECNIRQIEVLVQTDADNRRHIDEVECEFEVQSEQIIEANRSMKNESKIFTNHANMTSEEIAVTSDETHKFGGLDCATQIGYVNQEVNSFKNDIQSINQETQSIKAVNQSIKSQIQVPVKRVDVTFEWLIKNVNRRGSFYFHGKMHPYKYQLASCRSGTDLLRFYFRIQNKNEEENLPWPFLGTVTITIMDPDRPQCCLTVTQQCRMKKTPLGNYSQCGTFDFLYSDFIRACVNIDRTLSMTCTVTPSSGNKHFLTLK